MKAKLKNGETIRISDRCRITLKHCDSHGNPIEVDWDEVSQIVDDNGIPLGLPYPLAGSILMTTNIDWEQTRIQAAIAAIQGFASNPHDRCVDANVDTLAQWSVGAADALIEELKKEKK